MKKHLIIASVAMLAFAFSAQAQNVSFNNDLRLGSNGQDVVNLQTWLITNGYDIPAISSGAQAKGYYGFQTMAAVTRYQQSIGLPAYGFFGPLTRGWLNRGGGGYQVNSLRVTSPNGGETWQKGTVHAITWTGASSLLNQTGDIRLMFPTPACALPSSPIRCMIMTRAPYLVASGVNLASGSYNWSVGNVRDLSGANTTVAEDGQYKIQICNSNASQCDDSDNNFNITSSVVSTGQAPVINGVDAPTTLTVNQSGTWSVRASDPQNGTLSYSVDWGDSSNCPSGYACAPLQASLPAASQQTTFTHSYTSVGTYTVRFTVRNSAGLTAQTSSTVTVTGASSAGPLQILSPNGGENWIKGTTQTIRWSSPYYIRATYADLKLVEYRNCGAGQYCILSLPKSYILASNISINQNSYSWNVGAIPGTPCSATPGVACNSLGLIVPDGQYQVQICEVSSNNCESSDAPFTISSASTVGVLQVTSPNGGENWVRGTMQNIQWTLPAYSQTGYVSIKIDKVQPQMQCPAGYVCQPIAPEIHTIATNVPINQGSYSWHVGDFVDQLNSTNGYVVTPTISDGQYTIRICNAQSGNCDSSNAPFIISTNGSVSSQVTVLSPNGGEQWQANSVHQISWNLANNTDSNAKVDIYLGRNVSPPCIAIYPAPASCAPTFQPLYTLDKNINFNATYNWIVATDIVNNPIPAGDYVVRVCSAGSTTNCDSGNGSLMILSGSLQCPPGFICTPRPY